ncbi:MAG: hypothetical protein ACI81W_001307, partial [Saprospiraceae bacterium]
DAISQIVDVLNPAKIQIRDKALKIVDAEMRNDPEVKIQYASKFARIANYWKKWIGESQGIKATDGIGKKQKLEEDFMKKVGAKRKYKKQYGQILDDFKKQYGEIESYALMKDYYDEVVGRNIEIMRIATYAKRLTDRFENNGEEAYNKYKEVLISRLFDDFYKNYRPEIDQKVFAALMEIYNEKAQMGINAPITKLLTTLKTKDYKVMANHLFSKSIFTTKEDLYAILAQNPETAVTQMMADPLYRFANDLANEYKEKIAPKYSEINGEINKNQRLYMEALMEVFPKKPFYPDANSTMRVTYGKVDGYMPKDAVTYAPVTYLDGIIEKHVEGDYEFHVPERLRKLYDLKDYGQYAAKNGKVPVCFIGTNHTTGGNSGSPAIDAHGNLIGLNFDRAWEGTMSDYNYDASICRNIMVDVRYVLFIIDKYAGATRLIDEMTLVHPKEN